VENVYVVAVEGWLVPTEADQILRKAEVVHHLFV
jgi:hypothetical protein